MMDQEAGFCASGLSSAQLQHVMGTAYGLRSQMAEYFRRGVAVEIVHQDDDKTLPPISIRIANDLDFWIDCCDSRDEAVGLAMALGLPVVRM